jgi:hypothetical protein
VIYACTLMMFVYFTRTRVVSVPRAGFSPSKAILLHALDTKARTSMERCAPSFTARLRPNGWEVQRPTARPAPLPELPRSYAANALVFRLLC